MDLSKHFERGGFKRTAVFRFLKLEQVNQDIKQMSMKTSQAI